MLIVLGYSLAVALSMFYLWFASKRIDLSVVGFIAGTVTAFIVYFGGMYLQAMSHEFIAGEVTGKEWYYSPMTETYSCGTDDKDTCTRTVPRWVWVVESNTGGDYTEITYVNISPDIWDAAAVGQPFVRTKVFLNFQYVDEQSILLNTTDDYAGWLPDYPTLYAGYRVSRCMSNVVDCEELQRQLQQRHKHWGPTYGVNAMVAIVSNADKGFANALRNSWHGGKKNDTILVLYVDDDLKITNAETFGRSTSTKVNESYADFNLILVENAKRIGVFDEGKITDVIAQALPYFEREDLSQYDFLSASYSPKGWVTLIHLILITLATMVAVVQYEKYHPNYRYRY